MLQTTLTLPTGSRVLCYTTHPDAARIIAYDRAGIHLDDDGTATVTALDTKMPIGTWETTTITPSPGMVAVTWIGPDADTSALVKHATLATWIAKRIEPLLTTHPDLIGFTGTLGTHLDTTHTKALRAQLATTAGHALAQKITTGGQVAILGNHLTTTTDPDDTGDTEDTDQEDTE